MKIPLQVLVVQESDDDLTNLLAKLDAGGYAARFQQVQTEEEFGAALTEQGWDAIVADDNQSEFDALSALAYIRNTPFDIPFIVVSGQGGEDHAVQAMRGGAHDYVLKSNLCRLVPALEREIREAEVRSARKHADDAVNRLSHTDQLTGIPNRVLFYDRLQHGIDIAQRQHHNLALLVMDLDRFKDVNDTIGHYYGDELLQQVAARLQDTLGDEVQGLARMGGDEFAFLVSPCDVACATELARKALSVFAQSFQLNDHRVKMGASLGIAIYPQHGVYADTILQHADVAMYRAKYANSEYAVYDVQHDPHTSDRLSLVNELEQAIADQQLLLHYQPIVEIQSRQVVGVEALVRWRHPKFGTLAPIEFIPTAEQTSVIQSLSHWVLDSSLDQLAKWHRAGLPLVLSVNLPMRSLHDLQLHDEIAKMLGNYGVTAEHLVLEITERTMMVDWLDASQMLKRMSSLGIRFTLDDFGTGHFSLGHLKKLPIDTLKIDQSFVAGMTESKESESIIRAAVGLGHCLDLTVLAEGVENRDTWDLLVVHGCDKVQGNFICEPMPSEDLTYWIKHSPWSLVSQAKAV